MNPLARLLAREGIWGSGGFPHLLEPPTEPKGKPMSPNRIETAEDLERGGGQDGAASAVNGAIFE
jgi:hypothetical protein